MIEKPSRTRRNVMDLTISSKNGCWIKFQLNLRNIKYKTVAKKAGVSEEMITQFIKGRKNSERVKKALAETLGYTSFEALITSASRDPH